MEAITRFSTSGLKVYRNKLAKIASSLIFINVRRHIISRRDLPSNIFFLSFFTVFLFGHVISRFHASTAAREMTVYREIHIWLDIKIMNLKHLFFSLSVTYNVTMLHNDDVSLERTFRIFWVLYTTDIVSVSGFCISGYPTCRENIRMSGICFLVYDPIQYDVVRKTYPF